MIMRGRLGEMAERSKAADSKSVVPRAVPRVRIPISPPVKNPSKSDGVQIAPRNRGFFFIWCPMLSMNVC